VYGGEAMECSHPVQCRCLIELFASLVDRKWLTFFSK
jgi:hypothetical protein